MVPEPEYKEGCNSEWRNRYGCPKYTGRWMREETMDDEKFIYGIEHMRRRSISAFGRTQY